MKRGSLVTYAFCIHDFVRSFVFQHTVLMYTTFMSKCIGTNNGLCREEEEEEEEEEERGCMYVLSGWGYD